MNESFNNEEKSAVQKIADLISDFRINASRSCSPNYIRVSVKVLQKFVEENMENVDPYLEHIPTGFAVCGVPIELIRDRKDEYIIEVGRRIVYTEEKENVNQNAEQESNC